MGVWGGVLAGGARIKSLKPLSRRLHIQCEVGFARVPDGPVDLGRRVPRHRGPGMDRYEAYASRFPGRSTLDSPTAAWNGLRRHVPYTVYGAW